jgi:drug/metabolite transporter (DMT)-like permease
MERIGELAALATAMCWTTGALFFERGVKQIGALTVNFIKVVIAFLLLTITASIFRGIPLPFDATPTNWIFLSLSGFVGFVITDMFLFSAYGTVGPRVAMLFMALSPPITAGIAYVFLGESLGQRGLLGMSLVISGIILTIIGRSKSFELLKINREDRKGYLFAFFASLGQSIGMVLTKIGIEGYDAIAGTQIRTLTAIVGFGLVSLIFYGGRNIKNAAKNPVGLKYTAAGSVFGPFLGVTLSLFAIQRVSTGIVSTLIGLTPVIIIVPEILFLKKKIKPLEIVGALVAVCGTALFFL